MQYFSEQEGDTVPRENEEIQAGPWRGIRALIRVRVEDGSFGARYPENCFDGPVAIGTDGLAFGDAMRARVPGLPDWPWKTPDTWAGEKDETPSTLRILDMIQFCWESIGEAKLLSYHDYGRHNHLRFNVDSGREQFRAEIEEIFRRNGIAFTFAEDGSIERLAPPVLREAMGSANFRTGDAGLDGLLNKARVKFFDPDPEKRKESLEALWDAWERLKTLGGHDKREHTKALLDQASGPSSPKFREAVEREARELTCLGNSLHIRHSETSQEPLNESAHVDYLFHRLFSLIQLILRQKSSRRDWT